MRHSACTAVFTTYRGACFSDACGPLWSCGPNVASGALRSGRPRREVYLTSTITLMPLFHATFSPAGPAGPVNPLAPEGPCNKHRDFNERSMIMLKYASFETSLELTASPGRPLGPSSPCKTTERKRTQGQG